MARGWPRKLAGSALGLALGLGLAEAAFYARDGGAFPHLNVYVADPKLGVRLEPGATTRIAFGGNPATGIRINRDGFRGAEVPPPSPDSNEIVVVGDSQVFGLGVEEHETASARLAELLGGASVINAGVPTYGPPEYEEVVREILAKRHSRTVVYVVNLVNDLFEATRPNVERHVVWDGWAVRAETAPREVTHFPGRDLLFRRSHAVLALRSWWNSVGYSPEAMDPGARGFASEGTWQDLLAATDSVRERRADATFETEEAARKRQEEIDRAAKAILAAQIHLEDVAYEHGFGSNDTPEGREYRARHGDPHDIVVTTTSYAEESRAPPRTARYLATGADIRRAIERAIRDHATMMVKNPKLAHMYGGVEPFEEILRTLDDRAARTKRLAELQNAPLEVARAASPMLPVLRDVQAACAAEGARLVVVALPMDVQVSAEEWKKYGAKPLDMEPTKILVRDLLEAAEAVGATALDATPALAAAEPGAFLDKDIHMTAKGHRALAEALVPVIHQAMAAR